MERLPKDGPRDRAQTTIDFAIGAGVFLVVVVFVVAFVPGMFTPFDQVDPTQSADRFASTLATDLLGHPADGATLNATCTAAFFAQMNGTDPEAVTGYTDGDCRFSPDDDRLADVFATDHDVNVTIEDRPPGGAVIHSAGENANAASSVTTSRRVVLYDGRTRRLVVRVW